MAEREMTVKQSKWLQLYIELGNATEAAMRVYDCKDRDSASVVGAENLAKLRPRFTDFMEAAGITDALLAQKLREGLDATAIAHAQKDGTFLDSRVDVDWFARHRYQDTAHKLRGDHAPVKQEISVPDAPIQITLHRGPAEAQPEGEPDGGDSPG